MVVLLSVFGSNSSPATVAVSTTWPGAVGMTTIVTMTWPPEPIVPRSALTVSPLRAAVLQRKVAETKVTPVGIWSSRMTPVAGEGPLLVTVTV